MTKVKLTATEHLHESDCWEQCCKLFLHDSLKTTSDERIKIPDLQTSLFLYQAFKVFVMLKMKAYQGEDYNADDMRLRKICDLLDKYQVQH
jgi:hypothetical protein